MLKHYLATVSVTMLLVLGPWAAESAAQATAQVHHSLTARDPIMKGIVLDKGQLKQIVDINRRWSQALADELAAVLTGDEVARRQVLDRNTRNRTRGVFGVLRSHQRGLWVANVEEVERTGQSEVRSVYRP